MAVLTIGGQDYPAAFNLRSLRLFKKETGQNLDWATPRVAVKKDDGSIEVNYELLAQVIWALSNAMPNGPTFEFVESSIDVDDLASVMNQIADIKKGAAEEGEEIESPLAKTTEETSQSTGSSSGPSVIEG